MIFEQLLKEALADDKKPFETIEDLATAIKSCLNAYSKLSKTDVTMPVFSKKGYTYKTHKREIALKVSGEDSHALIAELKKAKIHCRYSSINDRLIIRFDDNVKTTGLLSPAVQEEMETSQYGVLGATIEHMSDINFNPTQLAIYNELNKYKLAHWVTNNQRQSKGNKITLVYTLIPEDGEI